MSDKPKRKRPTISMTLPPEVIEWMEKEASDRGLPSVSAFAGMMLAKTMKQEQQPEDGTDPPKETGKKGTWLGFDTQGARRWVPTGACMSSSTSSNRTKQGEVPHIHPRK